MSAFSSSESFPPLALLAGGLGTRLGELTSTVPKSLVMAAGEPFLAHQLRLLAGQGVRDIVLCCGHMGEQIEAFAGNGARFDCRIRYSRDGSPPLGTGGAIRRALPLLGPRFWVMYGDSYLTTEFPPVLDAFHRSEKPALMTVVASGSDAKNVLLSAGRVVRYDKRAADAQMTHIDYGLGLFRAEIFRRWPGSASFDLSLVQSRLADQNLLAGYEVAERYYEIGSVAGLAETEKFLYVRNLTTAQGKTAAHDVSQPEVRGERA